LTCQMCPKIWRGGNCKREGGNTVGSAYQATVFITVCNRTGITRLAKGDRIMDFEVRINISYN